MCASVESCDRFRSILVDLKNEVCAFRKVKLSHFQDGFTSLVKSTCLKTGKKAVLTIVNDIAIDINIMRVLYNCFVHLINNAIDHGIEHPAERRNAGKLDTGLLEISGESHDDGIVIHIRDDGHGIDRDEVARAVTGLYHLPPEKVAEMPDEELFDFLLKPGFTSTSSVTEVSGRGVGLDMVSHTLNNLGGGISIKSTPSKGTTISLLLPQK
jgi:two-component system chemotaxis sensor kinase CheA